MEIKMFLRLIVSTPRIKVQSKMRSTFVASLLVFILIQGSKPVVGGGKKLKQLQARVKALEECQRNI